MPHPATPSILYFWKQQVRILVIPTPHFPLAVCLSCLKLNPSASPAPKPSPDPGLACFAPCFCHPVWGIFPIWEWSHEKRTVVPFFLWALHFKPCVSEQPYTASVFFPSTGWLLSDCMGPLQMEETQGNKMVSWDSLLPICPSLSSYHMMPAMTTSQSRSQMDNYWYLVCISLE